MNSIIISHLTGEKSGQREAFSIEATRDILIGRDLAAHVRFGEASDTVSRQHARLAWDPSRPDEIRLKGLGSKNGLLLNGMPAPPEATLRHEDHLQIGLGGPEIQILFEPPPPPSPKTTRLVQMPAETREVNAALVPAPTDTQAQSAPAVMGRATVERLIDNRVTDRTRSTKVVAASVLGFAALATAGGVAFTRWSQEQATQQSAAAAVKAAEATATAAVKQLEDKIPAPGTSGWEQKIAAEYGNSVVYIEASWRLVHETTRRPVHHQHTVVKVSGEEIRIPVFKVVGQGVIEPALTLDPNAGPPIGGSHTGTGFVVNSNGFVLTNRHVGAAWASRMSHILRCPCAVVIDKKTEILPRVTSQLQQAIAGFVPANSKQGQFFGENQILDVTFPNAKNRNAGRLAQVSSQHDVALLRVDVPSELKPVPLATADEVPSLGQPVITMGFPGVSPKILEKTESKDPFNRQAQVAVVPGVTVTPGSVSRIINAGSENQYSQIGDVYQLSVNATGPGNSGGPVFDSSGKVSGIFFAGNDRLSFAVPIKYGLELLQVGPVKK